ncbi:OLC1v1036566C1 [Oldenlandia corymbosa var. corymbosa]|uniref:OLC1v1036566C1 n=1 Tax=Oldenlandia corymbosa var. corymbosa TaxID=529605 RepID=A0AAV1CWI8_OLDCO|nr:OLC1v1036566C1 [Oldenlandia corymbosa var. corymbosa]
MADLYRKLAKEYSSARPTYPEEMIQFIASKTPAHDLAWDAGTGTGQAAQSLAGIYKNVIASDKSPKLLEFAVKLPNVRYYCNPLEMSIADVEQNIAAESSVDLVTIATALHWFDLPSFYQHVKRVLKKPNGVIAAWTYTKAEIHSSATVNALLQKIYLDLDPYFESEARLVLNDRYRTIDFPFQPVDGLEDTGPVEFKMEKAMGLDEFFTFVKSWSGYQTAKDKGVEILSDDVVQEFKHAWSEDGKELLTFPINLRIGKVGS